VTLVEVRGGKDLRGAKRSKKVRNKNRHASIQITVAQIQQRVTETKYVELSYNKKKTERKWDTWSTHVWRKSLERRNR
jgi:hypothetical protein